ncbi:MAG: PLP-dependent aminotransferase family protein [Tyzzerella sp.]|nr:PLP-dependent aminotransferase family protein [Tyzzerella sp.]
MKYHVDLEKEGFAYIQLYKQMKKDIIDGVLSCGSKLPSKRMLAEETGVSVITVEHTYSILCDEGYIEARERSGYYVIYRESDFYSAEEHINEFHDEPHREPSRVREHERMKYDFPFSVLAKVMRKVLSDYGEEILVKAPNKGCYELRSAITNYLIRSNGIMVVPEQIVIGAGAEYLYSLIVQLLGENPKIGLEKPSYEKIQQVYEANHVVCDMLEMGQNGIRTSELEKTEATILHVTPFNSYPSGVTADVSKRQEYLRWAEQRKGYIIEDNYASELTVSKKNEDTVFSLAKNENVIYLNTFSETIAPSMRIGYMVLPEHLAQEFDEKLGFYSCTAPVFEQLVLAELLNNGDFERHINRVRRAKRKEKSGHTNIF